MSHWITIATYLDRTSADIAKGLLESAGIPAQVKADDMAGNRPYLGYGPGVKLKVEQQYEMEARQLLETTEHKTREMPSPPRSKEFIRAQTLCFFSFLFPIIPNLFSLYLMHRHRQSMILEKGAQRYMLLLLLNVLLITAYGFVIGLELIFR